MKSLSDMNGTEKAAALLVAMGHEAAAEILKFLDDDSLVRVSTEMAHIERLMPCQKDDLIGEFLIQLKKMKRSASGGEETARRLLVDAFGEEKAESVLSRVKLMNIDDSFDFLDDVDPQTIAEMTAMDHPQIIAVMLSNIPPAKAGQILRLYPRERSKEIAMRIARMGKVSPEAVVQISSSLRKKHDEMKKRSEAAAVPGGVNTLANILNHLVGDDEKRLIAHFDDEMPDFADEIRKKISSIEFESIASLSNREIRLVLGQIPENRIIAKALKGCVDEIKFKVLRNISNNRAEDVVGLMDLMGPIRLSEVTEARQKIVSAMRELNERGSIIVKKSGEEFID
jgi:flagellar motor switch protein FliG